ncbi:MAG: hypothetical protein KC550_00620, partial [Nanoarchaeota archaeon]|nr:hypothetical protein [Nanoarchaeota archaeon]
MKGNNKLTTILAASTLLGASSLGSGFVYADETAYNPNHRIDRAYRGAVVESNDAFRTNNYTQSGYIGIEGLVKQNCDALPDARNARNTGLLLTGLAYAAGGRALYEANKIKEDSKKSGKNGKDGKDGMNGVGSQGPKGDDGQSIVGPQGPKGEDGITTI